MLGVTRQFVDRLLADGVLACRRLQGSRHRRIRVQDVVAVGVERDARRAGHETLRTAIENAGLSVGRAELARVLGAGRPA